MNGFKPPAKVTKRQKGLNYFFAQSGGYNYTDGEEVDKESITGVSSV